MVGRVVSSAYILTVVVLAVADVVWNPGAGLVTEIVMWITAPTSILIVLGATMAFLNQNDSQDHATIGDSGPSVTLAVLWVCCAVVQVLAIRFAARKLSKMS
jgi:hypothetical protein